MIEVPKERPSGDIGRASDVIDRGPRETPLSEQTQGLADDRLAEPRLLTFTEIPNDGGTCTS